MKVNGFGTFKKLEILVLNILFIIEYFLFRFVNSFRLLLFFLYSIL
jgi:hypothetical protein